MLPENKNELQLYCKFCHEIQKVQLQLQLQFAIATKKWQLQLQIALLKVAIE